MGYNNVDIVETITDDFLQYTGHVMQERAVPDSRDCLKDGARKILYSQFLNKNTYDNKFVKGNSVVGRALVLGYLHGDQAAYQSLVRLGKPFAIPYPYEDTQGNCGNQVDPSNHAAGRYLELKMSRVGTSLFEGIKDDAIDEWYWNYSDTEELPRVLPTPYFYPLVNGAAGISVGLSVSIPSYNLAEVNKAIIKIIRDPNVCFDDIYCEPDFPMGGTIINKAEIKNSIKVGKGKGCVTRAKLEYDKAKHMIKATEMPFSVYTSTICEGQLLDIINNDPNSGISKYIDTTNEQGGQINIYLEKDADPNAIIKKLYKETDLQYTYSINTIMLENGRFPKVFGWREALDNYIAHLRKCKAQELKCLIKKAEAKMDIFKAFIIVSRNIDEVVSIIKNSDDNVAAANTLKAKYNINDEQTAAILAMKISSLTKLDVNKTLNDAKDLKAKLDSLNNVFNSQALMDEEIIKKLEEGIKLFGRNRRTTVIDLNDEDDDIDCRPVEQINFNFYSDDSFIVSNNKINIRQSKNKRILNSLTCSNNEKVIFMSSKGKSYCVDVSKVNYNVENNIRNLFSMVKDEKIIYVCLENTQNNKLLIATDSGLAKQIDLKEVPISFSKGSLFLPSQSIDNVVAIIPVTDQSDKVLIVSSDGHYNLYKMSEISEVSRQAKGVISIVLNDGCTVVNVLKYDDTKRLLITKKGGKIVYVNESDLIETARGRKGPLLEKNIEVEDIIEER